MPEWLKNIIGFLKGKDLDKLESSDIQTLEKEVDNYIKSLSNGTKDDEGSKLEDILKKLQPQQNSDVNNLLLQKFEAAMKILEEEKKSREEIQRQLKEQSEKEKKAKIDAEITKAIAAGKIPAANEDEKKIWYSRFERDFDDTLKIIEKMPGISKPESKDGKDGKPTLPKITSRPELMAAAKEAFTTN